MRISDWSSDVCSSDLLRIQSEVGESRDRGVGTRSYGCVGVSHQDRQMPGQWKRTKRVCCQARIAVDNFILAQPDLAPAQGALAPQQIGRASCRDRGGQYG